MRRTFLRELFYILFYNGLLFGALGCAQRTFSQAPLVNNSVAGSTPASQTPASQTPVIRGDAALVRGAPADLDRASPRLAQGDYDQPSGAPRLLDPPEVQPQTVPSEEYPVFPAGDAAGACDFWIVSSRNCNGKIAPRDAGCCLEYYHRTGQCLVPQGREAFMASLRPDRPVCFVIHGSYNYWPDVVKESQQIDRWIHTAAPSLPLQFVYFTWPSNGYMPFILPVDLAILGRRSGAHGAYLASLISQFPPGQPVSIVGHSHGARTAAAALHVLGGGTLEKGQALPPGFHPPERLRTILIAAAIDHNWLNPGQRYGQALIVPERVLLMKNASDATLGIYPMRIGAGQRALGKLGLGPDDWLAIGPMGSKISEFDVGPYTSWHHGFDNYHERPELATALIPYVYFQDDAPVTMGPVPPPHLFSATTGKPPATTTMRKVPPQATGAPRIRSQSPTGELWVEDLPAPKPIRQPVELGFEGE